MTNSNKPTFAFDGLYQFEKRRVIGIDAHGEQILSDPVIVLPWFSNLITNQGLDLLATADDKLAYCQLGTSSTAPAFTDTALGARAGATGTAPVGDAYGVSIDQTYLYRRVTRRFPAGSVSGVNLTEVGMSQGSNSGLFSRALLKDMAGEVVTITLDPDEVLDVTYEIRCYVNTAPVVVSRDFDGVPVDITMKPYQYPVGAPWLGDPNNGKAGAKGLGVAIRPQSAIRWTVTLSEANPYTGSGNVLSLTPVIKPYVNGSYQFTEVVSVPVSGAAWPSGVNSVFQGFGAASSDSYGIGLWTYEFSSKLNTGVGRTAELEFGLSWGRYTP